MTKTKPDPPRQAKRQPRGATKPATTEQEAGEGANAAQTRALTGSRVKRGLCAACGEPLQNLCCPRCLGSAEWRNDAAQPHPAPGEMFTYHGELCEGAILTQGNSVETKLAIHQLDMVALGALLARQEGSKTTKAKADRECDGVRATFDKYAAEGKSRPKCIVLTAREKNKVWNLVEQNAIRKVRRLLSRPKTTKG